MSIFSLRLLQQKNYYDYNEVAGDLPDYEDNPLQHIQPNLPQAAEPVASESVAPTTATENGNDNDSESSSFPWERSVDCLSSDTNLSKFLLTSKPPRRNQSVQRHSQMPLARWLLANGKDISFLVPCKYVRFV